MKEISEEEVRKVLPSVLVQLANVGSRVTCNPPPTDTDNDCLILLNCNMNDYIDGRLLGEGFERGGSVIEDKFRTNFFWSYTKGDVNLILIDNKKYYDKFIAATAVCKKLNLLEKKDRVTLFQYILYGNTNG